MNFLIDTHVLIWYFTGNERLNRRFISVIQDVENTIFLSRISLWEMAVKIGLDKLSIGVTFEELELYLNEQ